MDSVLKRTKQFSSTQNIDISDEKNSASSETGLKSKINFSNKQIYLSLSCLMIY